MVWPLIIAAATGIVGTAIGDYIGGSTKKEASITTTTSTSNQNNIHQPYENYQPTIAYAPVSSYSYQGAQYMINSPNSTQTPKIATSLASNPTVSPDYTNTQPYSPANTTSTPTSNGIQGVDFTMIAIIGAVAVIGYALLKK